MPEQPSMVRRRAANPGSRLLRIGLFFLLLLLLLVGYDARCYKNMSAAEGMDAAQLARNIAQGKGYTTSFVRPFSLYLLTRHHPSVSGSAQLKHLPDITNPPLYPVFLAGLMKVLPFHFTIPENPSGIWTLNGQLARYQPDFLLALVNQALFLATALLLFRLARRLFGSSVAWLTAILLLGTELLWRFTASGLSTIFLLLLFVLLAWSLLLFEAEAREPRRGPAALPALAALCGLLVGLGSLTRYSFGWLIIPVLAFVVTVSGSRRALPTAAAALVFAAVLGPWVVRNVAVCGQPFGTAGYALVESTYSFPADELERSLAPDMTQSVSRAGSAKLLLNLRSLLTNELPRLGGTWVSAFFLVGLLVRLPPPGATPLRYFLVASLACLVLVQALGRTHLSDDSPDLNSENLLVLVAPLTLMYGVALFFSLLNKINLPFREMRSLTIGLFGTAACLPLLLAFLPPRSFPLAYPPYHPGLVQVASSWTEPNELMMSDIPWAVAWYGQTRCVWLTLDEKKAFFDINDYLETIQTLYLTPKTLDQRFSSQWVKPASVGGWGDFILMCLLNKINGRAGPPPSFPLPYWQNSYLWPNQVLLTGRHNPVRVR